MEPEYSRELSKVIEKAIQQAGIVGGPGGAEAQPGLGELEDSVELAPPTLQDQVGPP